MTPSNPYQSGRSLSFLSQPDASRDPQGLRRRARSTKDCPVSTGIHLYLLDRQRIASIEHVGEIKPNV